MKLRLYGDYGWKRPTNLGLWPQSAATLDALLCMQTKSCPFLELESAIQTHRHTHECDCPEPDEELGNHR
jgi:hypothetical protein